MRDSDVDNLAMFLNMARILPRELDVEDIITEAKRQLRREAEKRSSTWLDSLRWYLLGV